MQWIKLPAVLVFFSATNKSCLCRHWFGDNLFGNDWVWLSRTWQILTVTRSVKRWRDNSLDFLCYCHFDNDYWKYASSRIFRNKCRKTLNFCDNFLRSVFSQACRKYTNNSALSNPYVKTCFYVHISQSPQTKCIVASLKHCLLNKK